MAEMRRKLGMNGLEISAMGLGCWAIGGPFEFDGRPAGWGEVDEENNACLVFDLTCSTRTA